MAIISEVSVPVPDRVATAPARAQSEAVKSHCPASVALACNAPSTSAVSHPSPESVATAERISQRFAFDISPRPSIVDSIFTHNAPDQVNVPDHCTHTLEPRPPVLGGNFQEYGAEYPLGTQHLSATHTTKFSP